MQHTYEDVASFHKAFGAPTASEPVAISEARRALRRSLIAEETSEMWRGIAAWDMVETADGLTDTLYVLVGTLLEYGLPLFPITARIVLNRPPGFPEPKALQMVKAEFAFAHSQLWRSSSTDTIATHLNYLVNQHISFANVMQIPLQACWAEVQRANMSKLSLPSHLDGCEIQPSRRCTCGAVLYREDGKVLKGKNYKAPDIRSIIIAAGWLPADIREPVVAYDPHRS